MTAPAPEPTYTLAEARIVMARQACDAQGHDLAHAIYGQIAPERIVCARCSSEWTLTPTAPEEPTA